LLPWIEDDRVRHPVGVQETARIASRVAAVDPEDYDAVGAVAPPERLEIRCLSLARVAPGGEEVQHDGLATKRCERDVAVSLEARQRERRCVSPDLRRRRLMC